MTGTLSDLSHVSPRQAAASFQRAIRRGDYPAVPPALAAATGVFDRLTALEQAPRTMRSTEDVIRQAVEDLIADRPVDPDEFDQDLMRAVTQADLSTSSMRVAQSMRDSVTNRWREVATAHLPAVLTGLRVQLDELMAEARSVRTAIGGLNITDPSAVAGATGEQRTALQALSPLAERYDRLRLLQRVALAWQPVPFLAGVGDRTLSWDNIFQTELHELNWPGGRGPMGATPTGPARILLLAARDDVWLPTLAQLAKVCAAHASGGLDGTATVHQLTTTSTRGYTSTPDAAA